MFVVLHAFIYRIALDVKAVKRYKAMKERAEVGVRWSSWTQDLPDGRVHLYY